MTDPGSRSSAADLPRRAPLHRQLIPSPRTAFVRHVVREAVIQRIAPCTASYSLIEPEDVQALITAAEVAWAELERWENASETRSVVASVLGKPEP